MGIIRSYHGEGKMVPLSRKIPKYPQLFTVVAVKDGLQFQPMSYPVGNSDRNIDTRRDLVHRLWKSPLLWFALSLAAVAGLAVFGPAERSLGVNVRVVYLHGAWVWAAMASFFAAALAGVIGLVSKREVLHHWSRALGRTGLFFWITYLPLSMWAMQTNWNGLFLSEPRWRFALVFAIGGLVLQIGVALLDDPAWASAANIAYFLALILALVNTENVMHPSAPILNSDAWRIQVFFAGLLSLTLLAAAIFARWLFQFESSA